MTTKPKVSKFRIRRSPPAGATRAPGGAAAAATVDDVAEMPPREGQIEAMHAEAPGTSIDEIRREGLRRGLFLRPLGNVVYLFLPQAVTREALDDILDRFSATLRAVPL